ncbi:hypothetical protein N9603_01215 [Amylibacter sp.]|nr:hypothetical protein [Amylibacter sp.]
MKKFKCFIIAGELSGDKLGSSLINGLNQLTNKSVTFYGIGGPMMEASGFKSLFNMTDLSLMGLVEIIPKIPMLFSRINLTVKAIILEQPDVLITIDSPDFCLRVAKKIRKINPNIKIIHYVAPSVWAWRPERASKMSKFVDHVLALLPFEPPYMEAEGMTSDFVGHPVVNSPIINEAAQKEFKLKHNLNNGPIITVLPTAFSAKTQCFCFLFFEYISFNLFSTCSTEPKKSGPSNLIINICGHKSCARTPISRNFLCPFPCWIGAIMGIWGVALSYINTHNEDITPT